MTKKEQQIFDAYKSDTAIFKSKVVDLTMENEQLRKENQQLKAQQTKLAVEKLEELLSRIYKDKCEEINLTLYIKWDDFLTEIEKMTNGLKGDE